MDRNEVYRSAKDWLPIAVKEIRAKLKKLKVEDSGTLIRELKGSIREVTAGSVYKAEILYHYYGIFPDMGVGKGVTRDEVRLQKMLSGGRKRKPWTREVAHQGYRFGEIMGRAMADYAVENISKSLQKKIVLM